VVELPVTVNARAALPGQSVPGSSPRRPPLRLLLLDQLRGCVASSTSSCTGLDLLDAEADGIPAGAGRARQARSARCRSPTSCARFAATLDRLRLDYDFLTLRDVRRRRV